MIDVDAALCKDCHVCIDNCPLGLIALGADGGPAVTADSDAACVRCGHCEAACPTGALRLDPDRLEPQKPIDASLNISPAQIAHHMRGRRSIRRYQDKPVDRTVLESIMDIARHAPSGHNGRPLHWTVVYDRDQVRQATDLAVEWMRGMVREKHPIAKMYNFAMLVRSYGQGKDPICRHAPHLVVVHASKENRVAFTDATIAMTYLELAAPAFDVGTCWAGFFQMAASQSAELQRALGIPEGHVPLGSMMLGYPKTKYYRYPERSAAPIAWK